jgi:hypothetical protein
MKYKVTLEVVLDVEAKNKKVARELVKSNELHKDIKGCSVSDGLYSLETEKQWIINITEEIE